MKLTTFILMISLMQVTAASFGQKLTLRQNNVTMTKVFFEIRKQTGYNVMTENTNFKMTRRIDADFNNTPLMDVMEEIVTGSNLIYTIEDKTVIIKEKKTSLIDKVTDFIYRQDSTIYLGKIYDEKGLPMPGATVYLKGGTKVSRSNTDGYFERYGTPKGTLVVKYIGYQTQEISLAGLKPAEQIIVKMRPGQNDLGEVEIVSTGIYEIPKERATGSFEVITAKQLQHSNNPNLLKRLEGITTSIDFNNQLRPTNSADLTKNSRSILSTMTIRGKNTLNGVNSLSIFTGNQSGQVLVVIDGIASPYSIDQVNPDDVESVTILKDAAAASIWGSRAANGVIVVTTKKGKSNQPLRIDFNSNFNITEKFNLFYKATMSTSDFINAQIYAYNDTYNNPLNPRGGVSAPDLISPQAFMSPVAEIMNSQKLGLLKPEEAQAQIDALRGNDIRKDFDKYILRPAVTQNYSLGLSGGSQKMIWRLSGGYTNNRNNTIHSGSDGISLNYSTSLKLLKNLDLGAQVSYNLQRSTDQAGSQETITGIGNGGLFQPYDHLVDDAGNPLVVSHKYRPAFIDLLAKTYSSKIMDYTWKPLDDINQGYTKTNASTINFRLNAGYKLSEVFSANIIYNYSHGNTQLNQLYGVNSFYMRDLINQYTATDGSRNIPLGGLYLPTVTTTNNNTLRGTFNANKNWREKHTLYALAGLDVNQNDGLSVGNQFFGYDERTLRSNNLVNFATDVPMLWYGDFGNTGRIPYQQGTGIIDVKKRTIGMFANAAYTYNNRYTISGSVRRDMNSEFGLGTNKGGAPYYSAGGKWDLGKEDFYHISWLPTLSLGATFGYNGNVNTGVVARPLLSYRNSPVTNLNSAISGNSIGILSDLSNRLLRPEKTGILNLSVQFGLKDDRLNGSLAYYDKRTTDLLAGAPLSPTTGFSSGTFNTADLHGWGTEMTLNSKNLILGDFRWESNFLFSYNREKVTKLYARAASTMGDLVGGGGRQYNEGADLSRLYAYYWAGLDPLTGDPRIYLNGKPLVISSTSNDFNALNNSLISNAHYFGSSVPVYFGSLRNTFSYRNLSVSANILYKFGYYFRRASSDVVQYDLLNRNLLQNSEFNQRWQKPGDELHTNVPSLTYPTSMDRDAIYAFSDINVLKADHIRLQEVNLSYGFGKKGWFVKNPRVYANLPVNVMLWRANKLGLDPDVADYPQPKTYSLGFSASF